MRSPYVTRAYKNHGRWVIRCQCGNAVEAVAHPSELYHEPIGVVYWRCEPKLAEHPRSDFCGTAYTVLWPDTGRIDAILSSRPLAENRNWWPGESFKQLVAENLEHGCSIPESEAA